MQLLILGEVGKSATTGLPGTVADAVTRHSGQVQFKEGENGVEYAGREGGEDWGTAAMKAFGARTIEYYSEMVGDYFAPIGDMLGKTRVAKALSTTKVGKMSMMSGRVIGGRLSRILRKKHTGTVCLASTGKRLSVR